MLFSNAAKFLKQFYCGSFLLIILLATGLIGWQNHSDEADTRSSPPVVEVEAVDYAFQAPDSIPSGWTTFRMTNKGAEHHNFHLHLLPEGRTAEDFRNAFIAPADSLWRLLRAGKIDSTEMFKAYERIVPYWAKTANLRKRGGMGYLAPSLSAQNTVNIEPGTYLMHCTIRAPNGRIHSFLGMRHFFTVTEEKNGATPPEPNLTARISGRNLLFDDTFSAGTHTVKFEVEEVPAEVDSAYYATIARLGPETSVDSVVQWPYWNPAPTDFLGGIEYIEFGRTPYVTVDLSSGRYLWQWNYQGADPAAMHKEFIVE